MKYLKKFKLFESVDSDDVNDIEDLFKDVADKWNLTKCDPEVTMWPTMPDSSYMIVGPLSSQNNIHNVNCINLVARFVLPPEPPTGIIPRRFIPIRFRLQPEHIGGKSFEKIDAVKKEIEKDIDELVRRIKSIGYKSNVKFQEDLSTTNGEYTAFIEVSNPINESLESSGHQLLTDDDVS